MPEYMTISRNPGNSHSVPSLAHAALFARVEFQSLGAKRGRSEASRVRTAQAVRSVGSQGGVALNVGREDPAPWRAITLQTATGLRGRPSPTCAILHSLDTQPAVSRPSSSARPLTPSWSRRPRRAPIRHSHLVKSDSPVGTTRRSPARRCRTEATAFKGPRSCPCR
jgi:hypothetical protein